MSSCRADRVWRLAALLALLGCGGSAQPPEPAAAEAPAPAPAPAPPALGWRELLPGLELAELPLPQKSAVGDSIARIVRADPGRLNLSLRMASAEDGKLRSAPAWLEATGGYAAINPGMFRDDFVSSVGWMSRGEHVNSARWPADYNSLLALDPVEPGRPRFHLFNLGCEARADAEARYGTRVQSIRMLGCEGENLWSDQPKEWSASLIGEDRAGRALLIHVRSPYRMHALVEMLRASALDLVALHYGEGGPEATLAVRTPALTATWIGSWETGFNENDAVAWASDLPFVLMVGP